MAARRSWISAVVLFSCLSSTGGSRAFKCNSVFYHSRPSLLRGMRSSGQWVRAASLRVRADGSAGGDDKGDMEWEAEFRRSSARV
eukprot:491322-Amorphochlora_amoeboformis.AAC.2